MASFNKVMLMGNLTRDVEIKLLPQGNQTVGNFGIAMNRKFKTASGEEREEVTFVDCEAWGRQAEIMKQYLSKGRPVFIEGRLKLDQWEDKEGKKQSKLRVVVENFQFIGAPAGGSGGGEGGSPRRGASQESSEAHAPVAGEDIPF
ncbi:MAG: single-stranded DNA-binding protein [Planctomycetes bacterium]|nr:single-stranded DNA-binding protein [Planctomycetota bacterium]